MDDKNDQCPIEKVKLVQNLVFFKGTIHLIKLQKYPNFRNFRNCSWETRSRMEEEY